MASLVIVCLLSALSLVGNSAGWPVDCSSWSLPCLTPSPTISTLSATPSTPCAPGPGLDSHQVVKESAEVWPYQSFKSSPFQPPELKITTNGKPLAPGLLFITPSDDTALSSAKDVAPLILTDVGQLVWSGPMVNATNFRVAKFEGKSILTYWGGFSTAGANIGHGYGNVTFLDSTYNEILTVCPDFGLVIPENQAFPCQADLHESFVTDRDTILVTAYNATPTDLSSIHGPVDGWVFDSLFFEIQPRSGKILFRWSALEHVPVTDSKQPLAGAGNKATPYDYFHINSVVNIGNQFLVNSRHVWSLYLLDSKGDIQWTLDGETGGDFGPLPANGQFRWQHDARPHNVTKKAISISLFNNYNSAVDNGTHFSNGLELQLSLPPNKAASPIVLTYLSDPNDPIFADSQGSNQVLSNGNRLLDFGQIPILKEFGIEDPAGGDVRWSAQFAVLSRVQSYRGFKYEWHGYPTTRPNLVVSNVTNSTGCRIGYVSWNGATQVERWRILEGPSDNHLIRVGEIAFAGFETTFTVGNGCVRVVPVIDGKVERRYGSNVAC